MNQIKFPLMTLCLSITALFLAAVALRGADPPQAGAPDAQKRVGATVPRDLPRDDPADVRLLNTYWPGCVLQTDAKGEVVASGIVTMLSADTDKLVGNAKLQQALSRLHHVQSLDSEGKTGDDLLLAAMAAWPAENLQYISLRAGVSDDDLAKLERFRSLTNLGISSERITDGAFRHLGKLKNLNRLVVSSPRPHAPDGRLKISGSGLKELSGLKKLTELILLECPIDDAGMRNLKGLNLKWLGLRHPAITDRGIAAISDMATLEQLGIVDTAITDEAFTDLAKLRNLRALSVAGGPRIKGSGLKQISGLKNLDSLSLLDCPVDDAAMKNLKGMSLKSLSLCLTRITDRALDDIKDMTTLEELYVGDTKVTKAAIARLKGVRALKINDAPVDRKQFGLQGDEK